MSPRPRPAARALAGALLLALPAAPLAAQARPVARLASDTAAVPSTSAAADDVVRAGYDFVPGARVLYADDFADDALGDFPRRPTYQNGSAEVVEWRGRRWLRAGGRADFALPVGEVLPARFTLEFELSGSGNAMELSFADPARHRGPVVRVDAGSAGVRGGGLNVWALTGHDTRKAPVTVRVMADGDHVKLYVNETRVANVPVAPLGRADRVWVRMNGWSPAAPRLIGNVRLAAGGRDLYEALAADGRVATQGIRFETASDVLRAESAPTLRAIADLLAAHPTLRLRVEGHTDAVGDARANQALSERRAAAVRRALVERHGVDGARLATAGLGAARPAATNATPEGRQTNRRVELVRR